MTGLILKSISFYKSIQEIIWRRSPFCFLSSGCRYYPTCSDYMIESIKAKGPLRGAIRGFYRVLRCNPLTKGGVDLA
ncbi:MAG: membrane protein insertion efficiency factor YidD [Candidatus Yanofskybacteria bacterium RIFCSPHIGHO2_02_FULL_44_12b]|uniref:Membrane protein insertion efficiency factor YidD n=1 Tax=Candidatus Yanofskybacteria bacterium RIFCSPLOWO2_01_FULL_44_22 TaxID=1802697 RepID=A0A1F8GL22_9BACT|nr:MAG: membrane protein insertion efficiency factor YidD [Candidatus Yanofskybacteria bacterium RIFCSPHIGHO2_01_FULL_44_24]OGN15444.1 MAG: membrane protein insertion efficiency factor YidD [Candidatus Yanofskybacteria bacterium RIFCSPHIGHO2_02_FULL_44_12b]OGN25428.1 MAG: membrane protein insertion efficiency factor YidD [Candidatus Yanofskybacteria bacterium RIFCSPLOWO2_01_FULL_44_22]